MGKAALLSKPSVTNQQINTIAVDESRFNAEFVYYDLSVRQQELKATASGSATPILNKGHFSAVEILVPPRATQDKIVEILGRLDDKIDLNRRINRTLETMAQAIFKSWFVDFDPVKAKIAAKAEGRDPLRAAMSAISGKTEDELDALPPEQYEQLAATAALFPDEMVESELGEIPEGWRHGNFGDLATLAKGSVNPQTTPDIQFEHYSLPAFDAGQQPVHESGLTIKSNKTPIKNGAVLQSKLNPHIPRVWFPKSVGINAICSTEFLPWMATAPASPEFIYCLLTCHDFESLIHGLVTGTSNSHQRVKPDQITKLSVIIPSDALFGIFSSSIATTFSLIGKNIEQAAILSTLRETILPKLLSGELSVKCIPADAMTLPPDQLIIS